MTAAHDPRNVSSADISMRAALGDAGSGEAHYIHPTMPTKMWCGCARNEGRPIYDPGPQTEPPTCVVCIGLRSTYGVAGWLALRNGTA